MLVAERTVAMRCPSCGKLNKRSLHPFLFSGQHTVRLECGCGAVLLQIHTRGHRTYTVQLSCVICELPHVLVLEREELWTADLVNLYCPETQVELGFLGQEEEVLKILDRNKIPLENLLIELDYDDFFDSPDVMWEVLHRLQYLASHGRLCCQCGNAHIEIDIFPDKVELHCPQCDSVAVIFGETDEDARVIKETKRIELIKGTATYLDRNRLPSRHHKG